MNLIKCPNNHYYNSDKLPYCPHCVNEGLGIAVEDLTGQQQKSIETASAENEMPPTVKNRKTTGWLVCIEGNMTGESFILYDGCNYIGRGASMDVRLAKEPTVSRYHHASITYHAKTNTFSISAEPEANEVLLNNQVVTTPVPLFHQDQITIGECVLLFVALCNEGFSW